MKPSLFTVLATLFIALFFSPLAHTEEKPVDAKKLTARRCSSCHVTTKPGKYTETELRDAINTHAKKLRSLTDEEKDIIVNYLKKS